MRLTNHIRDAIIKAAVAAAYDKRDAANTKLLTKLADDVYAHTFGADAKRLAKAPAGWLSDTARLDIQHPDFLENYRSRNHYGDDAVYRPYGSLTMSRARIVPANRAMLTVQLSVGHPLYEQAAQASDAVVKAGKGRAELQAKLHTLTYNVTTTEKLVEAWPAAKKFVPSEARAALLPVPADLPQQIDAAMAAA